MINVIKNVIKEVLERAEKKPLTIIEKTIQLNVGVGHRRRPVLVYMRAMRPRADIEPLMVSVELWGLQPMYMPSRLECCELKALVEHGNGIVRFLTVLPGPEAAEDLDELIKYVIRLAMAASLEPA